MKATRVFETSLYADDLGAGEAFYRDVLGLEVVSRSERLISFRCGDGVLLLFDPKVTKSSGSDVPSHGALGPGHIAFALRRGDLQRWREHLAERGVAIETEVDWPDGGRSIYFRDPAGNSVELAPGTLWGMSQKR